MLEMTVVMKVTASSTWTIKDCKNPTPYCYNGIATVIMPSSGEVTVWASDLDAGSFDNCTDSLLFTFDEAGEEIGRTFTCDDLQGGPSAQIEVEVWVTDEAGNKDFCITYLLIQAGDSTCADISGLSNTGDKKNESGLVVNNGGKNNGGKVIFSGIKG